MDDIWLWLIALIGGGTAVFTLVTVVGTLLLTLVCTIVPIGLVGWFIWDKFKKRDVLLKAATTWPATTGRVIKSRVEVSGGEHTSVYPRITYAYDVNGRAYQNDLLRAGDRIMRVSTGQDAYATVDRYPEGANVTVYYNPANPQESVLEKG